MSHHPPTKICMCGAILAQCRCPDNHGYEISARTCANCRKAAPRVPAHALEEAISAAKRPLEATLVFMPCSVCDAQPGTPELCTSCRHNRALINAYERVQGARARVIEKIRETPCTTKALICYDANCPTHGA